jgi:hypothetical protein
MYNMSIVLYSRRETVLNNAGKVIISYEFRSPSLIGKAVRIMEDIDSCDGGNINSYLSLN